MFPTPALPYIPQRPPFVLVDNLLSCNEEIVVTDFHIPHDHILVENGLLSDAGMIENVAQTCAARIGWINRDKPIPIGVIGAVNNFEYSALPAAGSALSVQRTGAETAAFKSCKSVIIHHSFYFSYFLTQYPKQLDFVLYEDVQNPHKHATLSFENDPICYG